MNQLTRENLELLAQSGKIDSSTPLGARLAERLEALRLDDQLGAECERLLGERMGEERERRARQRAQEQAERFPYLAAEPRHPDDVAIIACRNARNVNLPCIRSADGSERSYQWRTDWVRTRKYVGDGTFHLGFMPKRAWELVEREISGAVCDARADRTLLDSLDGFGSELRSVLVVLSSDETDALGASLERRLRGARKAHTLFVDVVNETESPSLLQRWERSERATPERHRVVVQRMKALGIDVE